MLKNVIIEVFIDIYDAVFVMLLTFASIGLMYHINDNPTILPHRIEINEVI